MKIAKFVALVCGIAPALQAQTATITDQNNAAISPSSVVGDPVAVNITGAPPNYLVALNYTYNGGSPQIWYAGYTNASGDWSTVADAPTDQIGVWTEQWAVGPDTSSLTNIGPNWNFEIFDKPTSLMIDSGVGVSASYPDSCGNAYGGFTGDPYGRRLPSLTRYTVQPARSSRLLPRVSVL